MAVETPSPAAPARLRSNVPNPRVLKAINPLVAGILRSRFHGLFSSYALLLTFTGRRTGKTYSTPVGYIADGDTLSVFSSTHWWKNLRGGAPVSVVLRGQARTGRAEVLEAPEAVLAVVDGLIERYGPRKTGQWVGIGLDVTPPPSRAEIAAAMRGRVVVRIALEETSAAGDSGGK